MLANDNIWKSVTGQIDHLEIGIAPVDFRILFERNEWFPFIAGKAVVTSNRFPYDKFVDTIAVDVAYLQGSSLNGSHCRIDGLHCTERTVPEILLVVNYITLLRKYAGSPLAFKINPLPGAFIEARRKICKAFGVNLSDGRIRLANTDYEMQSAPVTRQSTKTLIAEQTLRYEGFRINSPVVANGTAGQPGAEAATFNATLIYGGDRAAYLAAQREGAETLFFLGLIFALFGVVFVTIALVAALKFGM